MKTSDLPRTKIVATLGPACDSSQQVEALIRAGVSVFRLNFSHGESSTHCRWIRQVRSAARRLNRAVALLADLQGPKIRIGRLKDKVPVHLKRGETFVIVSRADVLGGPGRVGCTYEALASEVRPGERLLLDDGSMELKVLEVRGDEVVTRVVSGGLLRGQKGINLPGTKVNAPSLSDKDRADLKVALEQDVDFVALSFVRSARDVLELKALIAKAGGTAEVISKIERPEAVTGFDEIIRASDGVMVARGDMGVELGPEAVPTIQKKIIERCVAAGKPVITATQMLESMVENSRPTRAEASDVANAIYDGTSAVMLSAETAIGKDPALVVRTMVRIARRTESDMFSRRGPPVRTHIENFRHGAAAGITEATVSAAARAGQEMNAKVIVVFTESGSTAKLLARERLSLRTVAFTAHRSSFRRLSLQWGIHPVLTRRAKSVAQLYRMADRHLLENGLVRPGQPVVFIAGTVQVSGATNTVQIRAMSDAAHA